MSNPESKKSKKTHTAYVQYRETINATIEVGRHITNIKDFLYNYAYKNSILDPNTKYHMCYMQNSTEGLSGYFDVYFFHKEPKNRNLKLLTIDIFLPMRLDIKEQIFLDIYPNGALLYLYKNKKPVYKKLLNDIGSELEQNLKYINKVFEIQNQSISCGLFCDQNMDLLPNIPNHIPRGKLVGNDDFLLENVNPKILAYSDTPLPNLIEKSKNKNMFSLLVLIPLVIVIYIASLLGYEAYLKYQTNQTKQKSQALIKANANEDLQSLSNDIKMIKSLELSNSQKNLAIYNALNTKQAHKLLYEILSSLVQSNIKSVEINNDDGTFVAQIELLSNSEQNLLATIESLKNNGLNIKINSQSNQNGQFFAKIRISKDDI